LTRAPRPRECAVRRHEPRQHGRNEFAGFESFSRRLARDASGSYLRCVAGAPALPKYAKCGLRHLGYAKDGMTAPGFRAAASPILNESGQWSADATGAQLANVEGNAVRRAYARAEG
jgi:hypothetical protein